MHLFVNQPMNFSFIAENITKFSPQKLSFVSACVWLCFLLWVHILLAERERERESSFVHFKRDFVQEMFIKISSCCPYMSKDFNQNFIEATIESQLSQSLSDFNASLTSGHFKFEFLFPFLGSSLTFFGSYLVLTNLFVDRIFACYLWYFSPQLY